MIYNTLKHDERIQNSIATPKSRDFTAFLDFADYVDRKPMIIGNIGLLCKDFQGA